MFVSNDIIDRKIKLKKKTQRLAEDKCSKNKKKRKYRRKLKKDGVIEAIKVRTFDVSTQILVKPRKKNKIYSKKNIFNSCIFVENK